MDSWRNFWRLPGYERGMLLEAAAGLAATWVGLRVAGFRRWQRALGWLTPARIPASFSTGPSQIEAAQATARIEASAARHLPIRTNCLEQALVLWWLLLQRGIEAEIRIGGRKEEDRFEAHAWVELNGTVLGEAGGEHQHFVPFEGPLTSMETQTH